MDWWISGRMEGWKDGMVEWWKDGRIGSWSGVESDLVGFGRSYSDAARAREALAGTSGGKNSLNDEEQVSIKITIKITIKIKIKMGTSPPLGGWSRKPVMPRENLGSF